jgi:cysteine desulfurase/selenocysteine lyase
MTPGALPDEATLNQLASSFFAALPGQAPAGLPLSSAQPSAGLPNLPTGAPGVGASALPGAFHGVQPPANLLPGGATIGPFGNGPQLPGTLVPGGNAIPQSPQDIGSIAASTPARAPKAIAGNGLPDNAYTALPALDSRIGGAALGVPQAYGTAAPAVDASAHGAPLPATPSSPLSSPPSSPLSSPPSSPFYFLNDGVGPASLAPIRPAHDHHVFYFNEHVQPQPHHAHQPQSAPLATSSAHPPFDVHAIRRDFPILNERVNGRPLAWFDNAATTHKPQSVIDRLAYFYAHENSNIHRAAHELAARATDAYEGARKTVQRFIGASSPDEIIFVRGTTEGINLVAGTWGQKHIGKGDEIIVSHLEHHANIVPWHRLAAEKGAKLRVIPVDDSGQVLLEEFKRLLNEKTKLVSITQVSNALGTVVPVKEIVEIAHRAGAKALVDGAQSVSHMRVDVRDIDADFFVFSGHKIFGPTGIGVVYGKADILQDMPPYQGGGNMIQDVTFEKIVYHAPPTRFEAGTGNIADAVGLGAALEYVERIGIENIGRYEHDLLAYATQHMQPIPGVTLIGTARDKASVLSFILKGHTTEEVGHALNKEGIAVRTGHHCAQPILRRFGQETTVRPSLAFYNTCEEVDRMVAVVKRLAGSRR